MATRSNPKGTADGDGGKFRTKGLLSGNTRTNPRPDDASTNLKQWSTGSVNDSTTRSDTAGTPGSIGPRVA